MTAAAVVTFDAVTSTILLAALLVAAPPPACPGENWPVAGPVVRSFSPSGAFSGHWGLDLAADPGTPVRVIAAGVVTFAGDVAGRYTVTVYHGGGVRTSYSYLQRIDTSRGMSIAAGTVITNTVWVASDQTEPATAREETTMLAAPEPEPTLTPWPTPTVPVPERLSLPLVAK